METKRGIGERIKDFLKGKKKVIVGKERIMEILPHRERMLLLDRVEITADRITGSFLVSIDVCAGHAIAGERLVFRGVDILEMAAQVLGVFWGIGHPEFVQRIGLLRGFGDSKFHGIVSPGDVLEIDVDPRKMREKILGGPEPDRMIITVVGRDLLARVGKEKKATIGFVKLAIVNLESLA